VSWCGCPLLRQQGIKEHIKDILKIKLIPIKKGGVGELTLKK
jgi:hypothetical protein